MNVKKSMYDLSLKLDNFADYWRDSTDGKKAGFFMLHTKPLVMLIKNLGEDSKGKAKLRQTSKVGSRSV